MTEDEKEFEIDDQLAQSLTSAIASRAGGDTGQALFITAEIVMYLTTITGSNIPEFLSVLKKVDDHMDFSGAKLTTRDMAPPEDDDEAEEIERHTDPGTNEEA